MEYSSKRAERVVKAFINCVKLGEYTFNYACLLIEDSQKYGYLKQADKDIFYNACEPAMAERAEEKNNEY